jgi:putative ABC transport system permease protein
MQKMDWVSIDEHYVPTLGIKLAAGRNFAFDRPAGNGRAILINLAAARQFGWPNAVGKTIAELDEDAAPKTVIGVTEDFHQRNLYNRIAPLYMDYAPERFNYALIKLKADAIGPARAYIETQWKEINRSGAVVSWFLDEAHSEHYRALNQMGRLFTGFSLTALIVACLGLYGLTAFAVEARTREIGIRKSIGASGADIFMMLIRTFLKWVLIANIIAWPMVYWFNEGWLDDFPYRVKTNLGIMILAGLAALVIALATVGWKLRKAAGANPVDALRYE